MEYSSIPYQHCPYCGSELEPGSKFCHTCGAAVDETAISYDDNYDQEVEKGTTSLAFQGYQERERGGNQHGSYYHKAPTPQPKKSDENSTIALVLGILSCAGIFPCITGLIAIDVGNKSKHYETNAKIGMILGIISMIVYLILGIVYVYLIFFTY